ncbi:MAG: type VI secretion system-associated protein TagF [Thiolinea sp.]
MSSTMTEASTVYQGYYGKVPVQGDFVTHGLPRSFRDPWDVWLQTAMQASRDRLGERWMDYYLTCPLYRFVLSSGYLWQPDVHRGADAFGRSGWALLSDGVMSPAEQLLQSAGRWPLSGLAAGSGRSDPDLSG